MKANCAISLTESHGAQSEQAKDWAELQGLTNPMVLSESIREEVGKATKVLDNSTRLASHILELLSERDELYAKTLKLGGNRTDMLLLLFEEQAKSLQQRCAEELRATEEAFLQAIFWVHAISLDVSAALIITSDAAC